MGAVQEWLRHCTCDVWGGIFQRDESPFGELCALMIFYMIKAWKVKKAHVDGML